MKEIIWQTQQSFTFLLHELDITSRKDLETKYGTEIPVLMYGTRVVARTRVTAKKLGEQLRRLKDMNDTASTPASQDTRPIY